MQKFAVWQECLPLLYLCRRSLDPWDVLSVIDSFLLRYYSEIWKTLINKDITTLPCFILEQTASWTSHEEWSRCNICMSNIVMGP